MTDAETVPGETPETSHAGAHEDAGETRPMRANHHEWRAPFLEAFGKLGNVTDACEIAEVSRATVYRHRDNDPEFARDWQEAEAIAADRIHREMIRRGVLGVEEPVFGPIYQDGKRVGHGEIGTITRYSDRILETLAAAHMPDRFGTQRHEVRTGKLDPQDEVDARILGRIAELQQLALEGGTPAPIIDVEAIDKRTSEGEGSE